jgi:PAS domain S-box-containing protein
MPMPIRLIPKDTSLHTKLMLTLAILITLVVVCVAYVMIEHERGNRFMELEERADRMTNLVSHSVAYSVWNVDLVAIDKLLESLASDPEVVQLSISAVGYGPLREVTKPLRPLIDPIVRIKDISFATAENGSQKIGEVRVVMTRALVEQDISAAYSAVWVLVIIILVVMYGATFVLLRHVVSSPVNRLEHMVDRIALGDLDARCTVESGDELGRLALRINTMADRLSNSNKKLRDSEKRLQLVLDGSQLGYWDWNIETGKVIRDARWAQMLGYTIEEVEKSVKQWTDLHHPDDRTLAWESITNHLEGRTPAHDIEYRMRTKDGQYKWILDQAKIVSRDAQGKPLRMCGTHKDITERKLAEQEKEKLQNQLVQAQKMESVGQLAGGIAHDFNNMLSGIMSAAQLLQGPKRKLDEKGLKYVDLILQASTRAADLVGKLLTFSRKAEISLIPVDLHRILDDTINLLNRTIDKKIQISLSKNAINSSIIGDHSALENILINLGINASQAMEKGGIIQIRTENIHLNQSYCDSSGFDIIAGEYCKICVTDSGIGIPAENLQKIFEPFFTTKEQGKGTGLGLSATYGAIRDLHGEIFVESELGIGTSFYILLPCSEGSVKENLKFKKEFTQEILNHKTILFVDDEEINRILGQDILESLGYKVLMAKNGQEAIEVFKDKYAEIELVIMDMIMPVMNGSEAFLIMKKIDMGCKVIISSGNTKTENIDELRKSGLAGSINKPFRISELKKILDSLLNQ